MLRRSEVCKYFLCTGALESKELQSLDRVKVFGDFKVQGLGKGLAPWLNSLFGDGWPVEGVGDASEAFLVEGRNLVRT